jgi:hypothetical protein
MIKISKNALFHLNERGLRPIPAEVIGCWKDINIETPPGFTMYKGRLDGPGMLLHRTDATTPAGADWAYPNAADLFDVQTDRVQHTDAWGNTHLLLNESPFNS